MNDKYFVFDVESIGLQGDGFSVAGGMYSKEGAHFEFQYVVSKEGISGSEDDLKWVNENVVTVNPTHNSLNEMYDDFFGHWIYAKGCGALMAAECLWPVEANFLTKVIQSDLDNRKWLGPYPFVEVSSVLMSAGMDPMADYDRLENELPKHNPLADARQSARLLFTALDKLKN